MKRLLTCCFVLIQICSFAQPDNFGQRSMLDERLEPFYHGVASGDPTATSVILWTRITPRTSGSIEIAWRIAKDTAFTNILQSGTISTDSSKDYTAKVKVENLESNTWYYYEFSAYGKNSITGRTKTTPEGGMQQLRFAVVSCSNYPAGYFNAYKQITKRNDVDAVLHLGDYIYEYANEPLNPRQVEPESEIIKLGDYRLRYNSYRLDEDLRKVHQQYPFVTTWDDHESANNSYRDGAENHDPSEGLWSDRKTAAQKAYDEWLPIQLPEENRPDKIFRKISYGDLADIFVLDTRLYNRDLQAEFANEFSDTSRHILGAEQMEWLKTGLSNSSAKWKIIAQQVMFGQLTPFGVPINNDQWDGYSADRDELIKHLKNNNIDNVVVLTGDIHTAWAMDVPFRTQFYDPETGANSFLVEFVSTSVTSPSSPFPLPPAYDLIESILPHIKYVDLSKKGYSILDLKPERANNNFYTVPVNYKTDNQAFEEGWYTQDGDNHLQNDNTPTVLEGEQAIPAPEWPRGLDTTVTAIFQQTPKDFTIVGIYPNPFILDLGIQFNLFKSANAQIELYDATGKLVLSKDLGMLQRGLHIEMLQETEKLATGSYQLLLRVGNESTKKSVIKMNK